MNMPGYTAIRLDRDSKKTQKQLGGGLGMLVNNKWATNPREFGQITVILVYVPVLDSTLAADRIVESYNKAVNRTRSIKQLTKVGVLNLIVPWTLGVGGILIVLINVTVCILQSRQQTSVVIGDKCKYAPTRTHYT
ncbi:hypothetical protein LSAT2_019990 [Lamellibrachia satsuma]|nr:hypothetical protein LSAT2_019990 [Lamellibrachia satsuma]